jgi:hypothetical protein
VPSGAAAAPFNFVPATIPLNVNAAGTVIAGSSPTSSPIFAKNTKTGPMQLLWQEASEKVMKGNESKADSVDENFLDHDIWYSATSYKRPYPGESKVLPPDIFLKAAAKKPAHDSDD